MKDFEQKIIKKLGVIDNDAVNMDRKKIRKIISEAKKIAENANSEKWNFFIQSEEEYYEGRYNESYELNNKAYEIDKLECATTDEKENYYILNSLGVSYYTLGRFDEAIECFSKAISVKPDYYHSYIDRATVYRKQGQYDSALKDIEFVLNVMEKKDKDAIFYAAVESKGRTLIELGMFDDALNLLKEIYEEKKSDAEYLDAIASLCIKLKKYSESKRYYDKAAQVCKDESFKEYIKIKLDYLKSFSGKYDENASASIILGLDNDNIALIEKANESRIGKLTLIETYCNKYMMEKRKRESWYKENYIMCLKGWSSSTPEFSLGLWDKRVKCGGGFYLHYMGKGIVIDPGLNFIENLHEQNLFIQDIDVVIVTHNHIDHNSDLAKIFDMSYQTKQKIRYFLDADTYKKYLREIEEVEKDEKDLVQKVFPNVEEKKRVYKIKIKSGEKLKFFVHPTEHACEGAYGFKLCLEDNILGYTSDTAYKPEIGAFFSDVDIIIANISETNGEDINLKKFKTNHLGVNGVYNLLANMGDRKVTCFLSEFWGGIGDVRLELAEIVKNYLKNENIDIMPMDIGMTYFFDNSCFLCSSCGKKFESEEKRIIRIGKQNSELMCLCGNCIYH